MNKSILHAILATIALVTLLCVLLAWMAPPAIADRIDCWTSITGHTYCRTLDWSA